MGRLPAHRPARVFHQEHLPLHGQGALDRRPAIFAGGRSALILLAGQRPHFRMQVCGTVASNDGDVALDDDTLAPADLYACSPLPPAITGQSTWFYQLSASTFAAGVILRPINPVTL